MQISFKPAKIDEAKIIKALESLPDVKRFFFTDFEIDTIKKYVPTKGAKAVAKILNKTQAQIANKYNKLNRSKLCEAV